MIELNLASMLWRKSSHSTGQGGNCVEVAGLAGMIAIRDSKNPVGPVLVFKAATFGAFIASVRASDRDL